MSGRDNVTNRPVPDMSPHLHRFVIPVEWWTAAGRDIISNKDGQTTRATKLRCECGEEISR